MKKKNVNPEAYSADLARRNNQFRDMLYRLSRNKLAVVGAVIVIVICLAVIFANLLTPYDYAAADVKVRFAPLSAEHPLGTDNMGRDLLSRILYGGRISLLVALAAVVISTISGVVLGATAGYFGGTYEIIVMRVLDIIQAIPSLLLAVAISAALGSGTMKTAFAIAISGIPTSARMMRATVLSIRDQEFVEAAVATGSGNPRIIFRHILPNTIAPIIVDTTLRIGGNILCITQLSFVGLGIQAPTPEWGAILSAGRAYIRDYWPMTTFPGVFIVLTLIGFNLFGDGLRDALDPKLRR